MICSCVFWECLVRLNWSAIPYINLKFWLKAWGLRSVPSSSPAEKIFLSDFLFCTLCMVIFWTGTLICLVRRERWHLGRLGEINFFEFFWDVPVKKKRLAMITTPCRRLNWSLSRLEAREFHIYHNVTCPGWNDREWTEPGDTENSFAGAMPFSRDVENGLIFFILFIMLLLLGHLGYASIWLLWCLVSELS